MMAMMAGIKPTIKQSSIVSTRFFVMYFIGARGRIDRLGNQNRAAGINSFIRVYEKSSKAKGGLFSGTLKFEGNIKNEGSTFVVMALNSAGLPMNNQMGSRYRMATDIYVHTTGIGQRIIETASRTGEYPYIRRSTFKRAINNLLDAGLI